ncbi:hypothetical protein Bhyg_01139 [Pseudolycoriella hygida]|uniref:Uncharacterized protein n=1 Tax=Pseudolycoriella hygida TaxID=35572 RepID=A0A9Q0N900_9DIPT|nr:hypothetical protein Bhyg_01139 [Pseudolycoriella hygida]
MTFLCNATTSNDDINENSHWKRRHVQRIN